MSLNIRPYQGKKKQGKVFFVVYPASPFMLKNSIHFESFRIGFLSPVSPTFVKNNNVKEVDSNFFTLWHLLSLQIIKNLVELLLCF